MKVRSFVKGVTVLGFCVEIGVMAVRGYGIMRHHPFRQINFMVQDILRINSPLTGVIR